MDLIQRLMQELGISKEQATGGTGLLFKIARDKLESVDFNQIAQYIPELDDIIDAAPEPGSVAGLAGSLGTLFGKSAGKLGDLAVISSGFKHLGMDSNMITGFGKTIMSFLETRGGESMKTLIKKLISEFY